MTQNTAQTLYITRSKLALMNCVQRIKQLAYMLLDSVICYWTVLYVIGQCYMLLDSVICYWTVLYVTGQCYVLLDSVD